MITQYSTARQRRELQFMDNSDLIPFAGRSLGDTLRELREERER